MSDWFADTSGWAAALVHSEPLHPQAAALIRQAQLARRRLVTTNLVLAELVALLTSPIRLTRPRQIQLLQALRASSWIEVIHIDPALDADAWRLWESRPDKDWSLVDCASFVVMTRRGRVEALTTDHHFEQAGFVRLIQ